MLITLDTTRADHLGVYGYPRDTTPNLDAFAESALVFDRLIVPQATTLPSHVSLLTGVWPTEHGILANTEHGGRRFVPSDKLLSVAQWLRREGYVTAGFVSAAPLYRLTGVARGFDHYSEPETYDRNARATVDEALGWAGQERDEDRPTFLWVHLYDPHNPYVAPRKHSAPFMGDGGALSSWLAERDPAQVTLRPSGERLPLMPLVNLYDGEVHFMDHHIGRLLEGLETSMDLEDALVIVVGDHGEGLNQHGEPGHGLVWNEQLAAPLMMRVPGVPPGRVATTLSIADVFPTALGLTDLPHETAWLKGITGQDVLSPGFVERPVLSQASVRQLAFGRPLTYAYTGPRWVCHFAVDQPTWLWDLEHDPHQLSPVDDPEQAKACREQGEQELARQVARSSELGAGVAEAMPDDVLERLRILGYLDAPE